MRSELSSGNESIYRILSRSGSMMPGRFDLQPLSMTQEQSQQLRGLFPKVITKDKIDFERLRANTVQIMKSHGVEDFRTV